MPGIIEDADPGHASIRVETVTVSRQNAPVPPLDVEASVDRLRFMELDPQLIAEADRRLRANERTGRAWLHARLTELTPARKAPACDCGEPLVGLAWRGRASVRCSVCSSVYGIEVVDEGTESQWWVSGPSPEWREVHQAAEEFDRYAEFEPRDVLQDGLPPLPAGGIDPDTYFPVAMWQGEADAAVLYAHRLAPGKFDLPGDEYENETEHLVLDADGRWTSSGSGGTGWVDVFHPPVDLLEKYVVLGTGTSGHALGDEAVSFIGGLCSPAVAAIETVDRHGTHRYPVDPERPFFVVGVRGPGRVRILGDGGAVLQSRALNG